MSSSKPPPVSDGPIPFGDPSKHGGQQEFFGFQQQQQQHQHEASANSAHHQLSFFDHQGAPVSAQENVQQQDGNAQNQPYYPSPYPDYHQQQSDAGYHQQQYQNYESSHQQYYQQYQQPYGANQTQDLQCNYGQQQYDYSQEHLYANYNIQQQYDNSQQQPQYAYNQHDQYQYGQQQQPQQEQSYTQPLYEGSQPQQPEHGTLPQSLHHASPQIVNQQVSEQALTQLLEPDSVVNNSGEGDAQHGMTSDLLDHSTTMDAEVSTQVNGDSSTQQLQSNGHDNQQKLSIDFFGKIDQQNDGLNHAAHLDGNNHAGHEHLDQFREYQQDRNPQALFENQQTCNFLPQQQQQQQQQNTSTVPQATLKNDLDQYPQTNVEQHQQQTQGSVNNALGVQMNHQIPALNSPILPMSMSPRISSPRLASVMLVACPDPNCEGENKAKAKFCGECGRPISTLSHTTTPSIPPFSPQAYSHLLSPSQSIHQQQPQASFGQQITQDHHYSSLQQAQYQPIEPVTQVMEPKPIDDPLQRNKGCPLATFGSGGRLCIMFPGKLGIQDANAKTFPGMVRFQRIDELLPPNDAPIFDFVGPLLLDPLSDMATKKQDAIYYMDRRIDDFHNLLLDLAPGSTDYYHLENKRLLWQLIRHLIQEGYIGDIGKRNAAIQSLLHQDRTTMDTNPIVTIQTYLSHGDRSGALQYAIQENQWVHGLIIGKFNGNESWKNMVDQFVSNALSTTGLHQTILEDTASLRVLYSIFAGAGPESVNQLVSGISTKSIEVQLAEWKETLVLIMANPTDHSIEAIKSLGNLLKNHGWADAADICFIVYSCVSTDDGLEFGELLGSQRIGVSSHLDSLYLSELYELASSLDRQLPTILPFLQDYKLSRAWLLADMGHLQMASRYLQSILNCLTSYDKPNLYLNHGFLEKLKELCVLCCASPDVPFGIDLDLTLQDLEIKLNISQTQDQATASTNPSSYQHTGEPTHDTGLEPITASDQTKSNEETNKVHDRYENGFESLDVNNTSDSAPLTLPSGENDLLHQYNQTDNFYEQLNQQQQANHSQEYQHGLQQNQQETSDQQSDGKIIIDDSTKDSDLSYHGETVKDDTSLANTDQLFSSNLTASEPTPTESQPATLSAIEDISVPSYDTRGDEVTTRYDTLNFMSTYAAQDNIQDYGTSYEAQDYVSTYQAPITHHDYTSTSEGQDHTKITSHHVTQDTAENQGHDAAQSTSKDEGFAQHPTTPYDSQLSTGTGTTLDQHYTSPIYETDYSATTSVTHNHDYPLSYDTNATKTTAPMNESATRSVYPSQSFASDEDEKSKQTGLGGYNGPGSDSYSTKSMEPTIENNQTQMTPNTVQETMKPTNDHAVEDDKQDRKGWGIFSMFARMSPAPVEKDDQNSADAILGEPNSFYFDENEGRWVNRNATATPTTATKPPPPKTSGPTYSTSETSLSPPALNNASPTAPPPMSTDLPRPPLASLMNQGPPSAIDRRGPTSGKKKPVRSRYVDVLNTPTS